MARRIDELLETTLRIRPGEARRVAFMALYAANAIGAVVVGRTVRDALFLAHHANAKADLPKMYILNSVVVALMSWGYSRVADRFRRDRLNSAIALGWAVVLGLFFLLLRLQGSGQGAQAFEAAAATWLYVLVEAMGSLVVIQFWTFANDVFNAREAKRLFGLIGAGGQVANVVYGFLASSMAKSVGTETLLLLCAGNLVACAILAAWMGRRYGGAGAAIRPRATDKQRKSRTATQQTPLRSLATPHLVTVALVAVVSAIAVNLVDFQFKAAAGDFYRKDELGAFFGRFYGLCGAAALAIQMGVTGRMLERFGILASLLPLPLGLVLGSTVAFLFPSGWTTSLAKGSDSIFRYTINDASTQLLYVPVPAHQRGRAKALIDGILKPMAGVVAGLLLVGLRSAVNPDPTHLHRPDPITTFLVILLVIGWVALLVRGRREYVHSLLDTLQRRRLDLQSSPMSADQATADALAKVLKGEDALAILHALELLPQVRGRDFGPLVAGLLDHPVSSVRAAAADHLAEHADRRYDTKLRERLNDRDPWCVASAIGALCALEHEAALPLVRPFLEDQRPAIRAAVVVGLVRHAGLDGILAAAEELRRQLGADSPVERELAASVLGAIGVRTFFNPLVRFLKDPSPVVRRAALKAASRLKSPELVPHLLELLARRDTAREAAIALASFGPGIEGTLGDAIAGRTTDVHVRRALPSVLGRLGTMESAHVLQSALEAEDPPLRAAAARALARLMRRRSDIQVDRTRIARAVTTEIDQAEEMVIVQHALDLPPVDRSVLLKTERKRGAVMLLSLALVEEKDRAIERAIALLELLHPMSGLDVVAENLRSDTPSRRANAVEVLDNTVAENVKKRLLPLVEDRLMRPTGPPRSRSQRLAGIVAGQHAWIAACAARVAADEKAPQMVEALSKGLESGVPYVRESCASAIASVAPESAPGLLEPLRSDPSRSVRRIVEGALVLAHVASA